MLVAMIAAVYVGFVALAFYVFETLGLGAGLAVVALMYIVYRWMLGTGLEKETAEGRSPGVHGMHHGKATRPDGGEDA